MDVKQFGFNNTTQVDVFLRCDEVNVSHCPDTQHLERYLHACSKDADAARDVSFVASIGLFGGKRMQFTIQVIKGRPHYMYPMLAWLAPNNTPDDNKSATQRIVEFLAQWIYEARVYGHTDPREVWFSALAGADTDYETTFEDLVKIARGEWELIGNKERPSPMAKHHQLLIDKAFAAVRQSFRKVEGNEEEIIVRRAPIDDLHSYLCSAVPYDNTTGCPKPRKPRVLIDVESGIVQSVRGDVEVEYVIVDWDNIEGGDPHPLTDETWPDSTTFDDKDAWRRAQTAYRAKTVVESETQFPYVASLYPNP